MFYAGLLDSRVFRGVRTTIERLAPGAAVLKRDETSEQMDTHVKMSRQESFDGFYRQHAKTLWFYIYKICGDPALADDIFQEAFFRYLRAEPAALAENRQKAYLYKIAFRLVVDHARKKKEDRFPEGLEPHFDPGDSAFLSLDLQRTFEVLKPNERTLLWLAFVEGYTHREISDIMGLNEKSVKVMLFRVKKKFAGILKVKGYGEGKNEKQ